MTCREVDPLLEAFVDTEIPASTLLDVARHAGQCVRCDGRVQGHLALRRALADQAEQATADVDFAGLWAKVEAAVSRIDGQREWRDRVDAKRGRVPRRTLWGALAAVAAGVALFVGVPSTRQAPTQVASNRPAPAGAVRPVAGKRLPNHVYIDRLAGKDIALRREPKSGTTMIWVNHEVERSGW